mmetsp:Transcript_26001/g.32062  ORF Transcript_26001/g.32062 Transcript_26001/m.32062 type:complete len:319 (-) Transcript_26001:205-1161(-)
MLSWWSQPSQLHAYKLSLVSSVVTITAAIYGIIAYVQLDDSLILIYALENIIDFFSSVIVLWRFHAPKVSTSPSTLPTTTAKTTTPKDPSIMLQKREKRASIGVTIILIILGFCGLLISFEDLSSGHQYTTTTTDIEILLILSLISFLIFTTLAIFKLRYANKLHSASLRKDGLCSLIGSILAFAMFINTMMIRNLGIEGYYTLWWIDPIIASSCAMSALCYGIYGIYKAYVKDGYPILSCKWWLYSGSSSTATTNASHIVNQDRCRSLPLASTFPASRWLQFPGDLEFNTSQRSLEPSMPTIEENEEEDSFTEIAIS